MLNHGNSLECPSRATKVMSLCSRTWLELAIKLSLSTKNPNLLQDQTIKRSHFSNLSDLWMDWEWKTEGV